MVLNGDSVRSLAEHLGITEQSFYNKLRENGTEFKQGEISKIKDKYALAASQVEAIFFS